MKWPLVFVLLLSDHGHTTDVLPEMIPGQEMVYYSVFIGLPILILVLAVSMWLERKRLLAGGL